MATQAEYREANERYLSWLDTPGLEKRAMTASTEYTRTTMRESGGWRRIMTPMPTQNHQLTRAVDTDLPQVIVDKEGDSPAAQTVSFAGLPTDWYLYSKRYRILFASIMSPRFVKNINELRTWEMDLRAVISDQAIKDLLAEEDAGWFRAVDSILGAPGSIVATSGVTQHVNMSGGVSRETVPEAFKVLPRTPFHLEATTIVINNVTVYEFMKWDLIEMGGDISQRIMLNGFAEEQVGGKKLIVTIKRNLVPDDSMYMFADEKFLGQFRVLEDTTAWMKREATWLEWMYYETVGGAIGHPGAVAKVNFNA